MKPSPTFTLLEASNWRDYELLDSGDGLKMERFGKYTRTLAPGISILTPFVERIGRRSRHRAADERGRL